MHHHFDKQSKDILYENSKVYWFSVLGFQNAVELPPPPPSPSKKNKKQDKTNQNPPKKPSILKNKKWECKYT